jgi:hypothetical protein
MTRLVKISLAEAAAVAILATVLVYLLFHGYFDDGVFEIRQSEWSSANQVAMLAKRYDHHALSGHDYYVLIGNHLFTPTELRHALHSDAVIFDSDSDVLTIHWDGPNRLIIRCNGPTIEKDFISAQRQRFGNIAISYENIAIR